MYEHKECTKTYLFLFNQTMNFMYLVLNANIKYVCKCYLYPKNVCIEAYFFQHASNNAIIYMFFTLICIYHSIPISFSSFFFQISLGTSFTIYIFFIYYYFLSLIQKQTSPIISCIFVAWGHKNLI